MNPDKQIAGKIAKDVLLSILLYALPVVLMFLTFYFTNQKPWKDKPAQVEAK